MTVISIFFFIIAADISVLSYLIICFSKDYVFFRETLCLASFTCMLTYTHVSLSKPLLQMDLQMRSLDDNGEGAAWKPAELSFHSISLCYSLFSNRSEGVDLSGIRATHTLVQMGMDAANK